MNGVREWRDSNKHYRIRYQSSRRNFRTSLKWLKT